MNIDDLFKENYDKIYKYILSMLKNEDDAKDVTQITFINIYNKFDEYNQEKPFINWAIRVAKNCAIDFKRKYHRELKAFNDYASLLSTCQSVDDDYFDPEPLCGKQRFIYSLNKVFHLKTREIAKMLHMPMGTVAWNIYKAKQTLKLYNEQQEET